MQENKGKDVLPPFLQISHYLILNSALQQSGQEHGYITVRFRFYEVKEQAKLNCAERNQTAGAGGLTGTGHKGVGNVLDLDLENGGRKNLVHVILTGSCPAEVSSGFHGVSCPGFLLLRLRLRLLTVRWHADLRQMWDLQAWPRAGGLGCLALAHVWGEPEPQVEKPGLLLPRTGEPARRSAAAPTCQSLREGRGSPALPLSLPPADTSLTCR